jgi:hydrogenase expression/formation protein HypC
MRVFTRPPPARPESDPDIMCIGIPMRILAVEGIYARCAGQNGERQIDLALVGEQPPGTWVLTFLDSARRILTPKEAADIETALAGLEAALAGATDLDAYFADLIGRTPELPAHLKPGAR